jgi:hypothetical protein
MLWEGCFALVSARMRMGRVSVGLGTYTPLKGHRQTVSSCQYPRFVVTQLIVP